MNALNILLRKVSLNRTQLFRWQKRALGNTNEGHRKEKIAQNPCELGGTKIKVINKDDMYVRSLRKTVNVSVITKKRWNVTAHYSKAHISVNETTDNGILSKENVYAFTQKCSSIFNGPLDFYSFVFNICLRSWVFVFPSFQKLGCFPRWSVVASHS